MFYISFFCCLLLLRVNGQTTNASETSSGGFLADVIPLEVVTTTPTALTRDREVFVRGQQAITAVFSRPVIALGSDFGFEELPSDLVPFTLDPPVPGRGRWVTTFIYRFDTDGPFATDLRLTFAWNLDLLTYDGVPLVLESAETVTLTTPTLSMDIADVRSELANNATDNEWSATAGLAEDFLPEVPADGVIELSFNAPVSLEVLQENLKVTDESEKIIPEFQILVEPCFSQKQPVDGESECANVTVVGDLEIATRYFLLLEAGVEYADASGPLTGRLTVGFGGLRLFRIPFVEFRRPRFSTRFLDIYLPHGLGEGVDPSSIPIDVIEIKFGSLNVTVVPVRKSVVRLLVPLNPNNNYDVIVLGSDEVIDGFGLALQPSRFRFRTQHVSSEFAKLSSGRFPPYAVFESTQDWGRQMLSFAKRNGATDRGVCGSGNVVDMWSIEQPERGIVVFSGSKRTSFERFLGAPDDQLLNTRSDFIAQLASKDITPLFGPSGITACQLCRFGSFQPELMVETNVQVSVIGYDQTKARQQLTVWVTSMETGEPVAEAVVSLFWDDHPGRNPKLVGGGITDDDGIAHIANARRAAVLVAIVRVGFNYVYVPNVQIGSVRRTPVEDAIILDRALVRPGNTLHVKGYVMQRSGRRFVPAMRLRDTVLQISPPLVGNASVPVVLNEEFGSYEALIEVPEEADLQIYTLQLRGRKPRSASESDRNLQRFFGSSERFTVADPRLPTIELSVDTPFWVRPTGEIEIGVNVESFIGSAVGGTEITVEYTIEDTSTESDDEPVSGELTITTDDSGNGTAVIDLSELDTPPSIGSTVSIDFQLVGPTGELIEDTATVRIEAANVELSLSRTVETDIPQQVFGVAVTVTDLRGAPLTGDSRIETATVSLIELSDDVDSEDIPTTSSGSYDGPVVTTCEFQIGGIDYCDFALPSVGEFLVEACVEQGDATVCERIFAGKTAEDWESNPLDRVLPIGFIDLTEEKLELGEEKEILIENPYDNAYALVSWGTIDTIRERTMQLPSGRSSITVDVEELCEFGCGLSIIVAVPRQTEGIAANVSIPVSKLFDAAVPHTKTYDGSIRVRPTIPTEIEVSISFPDARVDDGTAVMGPGENTTVEVKLDVEVPTEVTLIAVDKSVLELLPYALVDVSAAFLLDLSTEFTTQPLSEFIVSPGALQALIDNFNSRKELDPWFPLASSVRDGFRVDLSESEYIERESEFITIQFVGRFRRRVPRFAFFTERAPVKVAATTGFASASESFGTVARSAPFAEAEGVGFAAAPVAPGADVGADQSLRLESDFVTTPLFDTQVTEDGTLRATFTSPSNLGTFVIRAYAASNTGVFGSAESEIIVRRELSLTPSVPRFVRTGDVFDAGAVVTVSGAPAASVSLSVQIDGPVELIGDDTISVDVGADGQEEARFTLRAIAVGSVNLTLTATDDVGNTDGLQLEIEIEGLQEGVTVGTSFTVEGEDTQSFVEGIDLPQAVPGSGDILITAGVGRQPSVFALADQTLRVRDPFDCPVDGDFVLASVAIPSIVNPYNLWNPEPGTLGDDLVALIELMLSHFEEASKLILPGARLTTRREGLRRYLPCPRNDIDRDPSFFQNAKGVFVMMLVEENLRNHALPEVRSAAGSLLDTRDIWRRVLGSELERQAIEARGRPQPGPISVFIVAFGRVALGAGWTPETRDETIIDDLSMERLSREFSDLSVESQAYYILARLAEPDGTAHPDITIAMQTWTDLLRITGRTAYISAFTGSPSPASDLANALVFLAMTRAGQEGQLIPRLASYVASPPADNFGFRFFATYPKLVAMHALVEFDVSRGSAQPDLEFEAVSGKVTLLTTSFTNASTPVASGRVPWEDLPEEPQPIEVSAVGSGEATVSITLNFVPIELLRFPTYRGIFVERSIQLEDAEEGDGPGLSIVPRGSVVSVKVQFLTPDALGETVVRVLMPAGLEPVDPNVSGDEPVCPVPFFSLYSSFFFFFRCPVQETRPSVVTFTFDSVRSGTTSVSFRAVAATVGVFALPPTRVFAVDQPEVMGLSSAGAFQVCSGRSCDFEFVEAEAAPINCPDDCNGSGTCNLQEGTCMCFAGFTGESCGTLIET